jgi:hypothetical protein
MNQLITSVKLSTDFINFKRPSPHSKFSPSSADRWLITGCPFSTEFIISMNYEEEKTEYSEEGTLAHSYCEAMFRHIFYGLSIPAKLINDINTWIMGDFHKRQHALEEMDRCAREYVDVLSFWLNNQAVLGDIIYFKLEAPTPIIPEEGCFGTSDCIIVGTRAAVIIDFKYGKGKNVSADTVQCKVYAAGLLRYMANVPEDYNFHVVIHQPRTSTHPKEHVYTRSELGEFLNVIWHSIQESKRKDLQPCKGSHCFWCPAKRTKIIEKLCPEIREAPVKLANERFDSFLQDMYAPVESIVAENPKRDMALLKIHALFPLMKQIVKDSTEEIKMRLEKGEVVYGFTLTSEEGKREISGENEADKAKLITEKFGINPWKEVPATQKLMTITEIEKILGKNKLNVICTKKITKKVDILSDKMQTVLGDMTAFAQMINNGEGQEE